MSEKNFVEGMRLYTHQIIDSFLGEDMAKGYQRTLLQLAIPLAKEVNKVAELGSKIFEMMQPVAEETPEFKSYIQRTSHVRLPTGAQMKDFANALDAADYDFAFKGNFFHGYHFFIDPSAGQEELVCKGNPASRISRKEGDAVSRKEYVSRFGHVEFRPVSEGLELLVPNAFVEDRKIDFGNEDPGLYVPVPKEITSLVSIVGYYPQEGSSERRDAFLEQVQRMVKVVKQGRKKYCG